MLGIRLNNVSEDMAGYEGGAARKLLSQCFITGELCNIYCM
jgi:hypothetical protein